MLLPGWCAAFQMQQLCLMPKMFILQLHWVHAHCQVVGQRPAGSLWGTVLSPAAELGCSHSARLLCNVQHLEVGEVWFPLPC